MANRFYVAPPNPLQALLLGEQSYNEANQNALRQRAADLYASGDKTGALSALLNSGDSKLLTGLAHYEAAANSVYGTPIYGTDEQGNTAVGTFDKKGQFRPITTPGFTPTPGVKTIQTPQGEYVINSKSGAPVGGGAAPTTGAPQPGQPSPGFYPADNRGAAFDKEAGKVQGEKASTMGQAKSALDTAAANIDRMSDVARSIKDDPALSKITGIQGVFPNMPGGRAANVQARLDNLTSQVGFSVLEAMRNASKTGGALGSITEGEHKLLQNNLIALSRAQDEKQYREQLQKLIDWGDGVKQRLQAAYDKDYGSLPNASPGRTAPQGVRNSKTIGNKTYFQDAQGNWFEQ